MTHTRVRITEGKYLVNLPIEGDLISDGATCVLNGDNHRFKVVIDEEAAKGQPVTPTNEGLVVFATKVEPVTPAPERPLVDFSGPSRATARTYASEHTRSQVLTPESRTIFKAVTSGQKVDAYALNEAVLDAMRSATTRCGQSPLRRQMATRIAYLGHIVQAVLENHADGLPAYSEGARSRKIEELSDALRAASALNDRLEQEIRDNHAQAVEEGATLAQRIEEVTEQRDRLLAIAQERDSLLTDLTEEVTRLKALRKYTEDHLLDAEGLAAAAGFTHGYVAGEDK